jgi:hypothetical protein
VRDFAKATGQLAKTDRIDAAILALFAERVRPTPAVATLLARAGAKVLLLGAWRADPYRTLQAALARNPVIEPPKVPLHPSVIAPFRLDTARRVRS